jgi:mannose-1-phosphate guanylyltransferase
MGEASSINRAFILGAGLGTRLRPITENLPKPLVSVRGNPLVTYAFRHVKDLGVREVMINTHHAPSRWAEFFPQSSCEGLRLNFRHEPVLLDTGGGLKNVEDFLKSSGTFCIYNGDILTDLPLKQGLQHHRAKRNLVTMVLRSEGGPKHVGLDAQGRVIDIRGMLGATGVAGLYLFTGIHFVEPEIFQYIPEVKVQSIIQIYLDLIRQGLPIGGVILDEGEWSDVGTVAEYERLKG